MIDGSTLAQEGRLYGRAALEDLCHAPIVYVCFYTRSHGRPEI